MTSFPERRISVSPRSVRAGSQPPLTELQQVADIIEQAIDRYLTALKSISTLGQWEAPIEGWALGWLLIRNVEAVIELARHDGVLVTAAWSNTRVAFEQGTRIIWLLHPGDRYQAECRWLAFLADYENFERNMAREVPEDAEHHVKRAEAIREFRMGVTSRLPPGYQPEKTPNFRDMLRELDNPELYRYYREGSQYVHGSMQASGSYRRDLGTARKVGEFTSAVDWVLPLRLCWLIFRNTADMLISRLNVPEEATPAWDDLSTAADIAFQSLTHAAIAHRESL